MLPNKICKISIILIIISLFASCGISPIENKLPNMAAVEDAEVPSMIRANTKYNIEDSVKSIEMSNDEEYKRYLKFIRQYISPAKLVNFVDFRDLYLGDYNEKATGHTVLRQMKFYAYKELFNELFNRERTNFDDCPVTENFKQKFKPNVFHYYKFNDVEDSSVNCGIDDDALQLSVNEAGDFIAGEPGYIYYHHFHYTLDGEGNVDDIMFDYTE